MPCYHPLRAWRGRDGTVKLAKEIKDATQLHLPCGKCIGCKEAHAKSWAIRCKLELLAHNSAIFTTLTFNDDNLPLTLDPEHLQLWLKRLRKRAARPIRFFASGEYGEQNKRPHYHAIVYGLTMADAELVQKAWAQGFTQTQGVTHKAISYVAGYCNKKLTDNYESKRVRLDPTGTHLYKRTAPFIQMSRNPGIGANAKEYRDSWRLYAIDNGYKQKVPRYLKNYWKDTATKEEIEQLEYEVSQLALRRDTTKTDLKAAETIALAKHKQKSSKRLL